MSGDRARSADSSRPTAAAFPRTLCRTQSPGNPPNPPCTAGPCSGSSTVSPEVTVKCSRSTLEPSASCTRTSASREKTTPPPPSTGVSGT